jgi:hypothetical protein
MLYAGWTTVAIALMLTLLRIPVSLGWMGMAVLVVLSSGAWWRLHRGFEDGREGIGR